MAPKIALYKRRLLVYLTTFVLAFCALFVQLVRWQVVSASELQREALGQWTSSTVVAAHRGSIYDRKNELLAVSALSKSLIVKPKTLKAKGDANRAADVLSAALSIEREKLYTKLTNTKFAEVNIKRHLTDDELAAVNGLDMPGLELVDDNKRYYPKGSTLAQVLGSCATDGVGREGLELAYDKYLRGLTGKILSSTDVWGNQIPGGETRYIDPSNGLNLSLTIDYAIQKFAENAAAQALVEQKAKKVEILVMDPSTGEILAMVNAPDYDLNNLPSENYLELSRNSCIIDSYEPGSTFKIFTMSAALNEGAVTLNSTFYDPGFQLVDGQKIRCWRTVPHGHQTLIEAACNSCNVAFMQMGLKLGTDKMYQYIRAFGFGSQTNVDFSSEQSGIVLAQKYVQNVDLARISFGQTIAVTPLQLLTATCAAINGGKLMQPYLVRALLDDSGKVITEHGPVTVRQVISAQTSQTVREVLEQVVEKGSGKNASIAGYRVGGKTGTAQIYKDGVIVRDKHIASFVGFAPADDPKIAVLVTVTEPDVYIDFGSVVAAPYAKAVMESTLKYMKIPPVNLQADQQKLTPSVTIPNLRGKTMEEAAEILQNMGLLILPRGRGKVTGQTPAAGELVIKGSAVLVSGDEAVDAYTDFYPDD